MQIYQWLNNIIKGRWMGHYEIVSLRYESLLTNTRFLSII